MENRIKQALGQLHELRKQNKELISQMTVRVEGTNEILICLSNIIESATSLRNSLKKNQQKDEDLHYRLVIQDIKIGEMIDSISQDIIRE